MILDDVPSAVGSLPTVLANAGIKYFIEGVNGDRAPYATEGLKNPFYWEGPDGSRVLSSIARGYGMASGLISSMEQANEQLPGLLAGYENAGYPYDAVLVNGAFYDNQPVAPWLPEVVEKWNAQWEYPKLILGRPEDFFRYIEQNFAAKIPVMRADFGDVVGRWRRFSRTGNGAVPARRGAGGHRRDAPFAGGGAGTGALPQMELRRAVARHPAL